MYFFPLIRPFSFPVASNNWTRPECRSLKP